MNDTSNDTPGATTGDRGAPRIVVATASLEIGDLLAIVLGDAGYAVERAASPEGAAALVRAQPTALLLTDLFAGPDRPDEDLLGVVRALRSAVAPCPVGLMTAWSVETDVATREGFAVLIRQPFDLEDLLLRVAIVIAQPFDAEHGRQVDVVHRYFAALTARDWDALVDLCTDALIYVLPKPAPFATTLHGKADFRAYTEATFRQFPAARFGDVRAHAMPRGIAAQYRATWGVPSGEEVGQDGVVLFAFEGGRIAQIGVHLDADRLRGLLIT